MTKTNRIIVLFSGFALLTLAAALASMMAGSWSH
jgi:hypothetical protein